MPKSDARDPYTYPGMDVLINKFDIRNADRLRQAEADMTYLRLRELEREPVIGLFDLDHLRAIHRYLFGDVYDWAGDLRTMRITKGNTTFAFPAYLAPESIKLFDQLQREHYLKGLPIDEVVRRAAYYMGELNALHPFREGNGRTQREFIRELLLQVGFDIAWHGVTQADMTHASIESMATRLGPLEAILRRITTPRNA